MENAKRKRLMITKLRNEMSENATGLENIYSKKLLKFNLQKMLNVIRQKKHVIKEILNKNIDPKNNFKASLQNDSVSIDNYQQKFNRRTLKKKMTKIELKNAGQRNARSHWRPSG